MPKTQTVEEVASMSVHEMDLSQSPPETPDEPLEQDQILPDDDKTTQPPPDDAAKPEESDDAEEKSKEEKESEDEVQSDGDDVYLDERLKELGFPELPDTLREDPEVSKRYYETQAGIINLLDKTKKDREEATHAAETLSQWVPFAQGFASDDLSVRRETYKRLGGVLGLEQPVQTTDTRTAITQPVDTSNFQALGFEYSGEYTAYVRAKEEAKREAKQEFLSEFGEDLKALREERKAKEQEAQFTAFVDGNAPKVIGYLAKTENGWSVTKDMVAQALRKFPQLQDSPHEAVKAMFADKLAEHKVAKALASHGKKGPEMLPTRSAKGVQLPDKKPWEMSVHELHAAMQATGTLK